MKKVYRVTLWHAGNNGKGSTWTTDTFPQLQQGNVFHFRATDGSLHWVTGNVEISEFEQPT